MKICCLIDSLNSGGAQRQMTWLVRSLVELGHDVRLLTYHQFDHYLPLVQSVGVEPENVESSSKAGRFWNVRSAIRRHQPDAIISFLDTPNLLGVFASLPPKRIPIIVAERNHDIGGKNLSNRVRFNAFRQASKVVTNCWSQNDFVKIHFPFLREKLHTIVNCVDLEKFRPVERHDEKKLAIMVAASVCDRKNPMRLIRASAILCKENVPHSIDWYGNNFYRDGSPTSESKCFLECQRMIGELGLKDTFQFHGPVADIHSLYGNYDVTCLPSLREGCPNVVCESMACGVPLLTSDHGDMRLMVGEQHGFRFDPMFESEIASAINRMASLSREQRQQMGRNCRLYAEETLGPKRFASEYQGLIEQVVS